MQKIFRQWVNKLVIASVTGLVALSLVVAVSALPTGQSAGNNAAGDSYSPLVNWNAGGS